MERDLTGKAVKMGVTLGAGGLIALRILVDSTPWPWMRRRVFGERLGVWLLAVAWVVGVVSSITLFS